jgi:RNA polymerase sigma-70 factor (ECF subfamily)
METEVLTMAAAVANNEPCKSIEEIMAEHSNVLLRTAFVVLGDLKLAEDAVQETFIKYYYNGSQFRGDSSIKTYLCRILLNECRQKMRRNWFKRVTPVDSTGHDAVFGTSSMDGEVDKLSLSESLQKLDMKYREVILLHYYHDLPVNEISRVTGSSEGTIKSRLKRARERLGAIMREEGLFYE